MTIDASLLQKMQSLPPDKRQEVADFVDFLTKQTATTVRGRRLRGLCADLGVAISAEDIDHSRHEVWGALAREDV